MPFTPYENEQKELLVKGIPLNNILVGSGVVIVLTIIIWLVKR